MFFLSAFGLEDGGKKGTKTSRNGGQYGRKSIPEESAKKKRGKYENEQQSYVLARFWVSAGVENRRGNRKKGVENDSKSKGNFEADFQRIFVDFGSILESRMDPKSKKKIKNKTDFKTNAWERMRRSGPKLHVAGRVVWSGIGPGAPRNSRPVEFLN